MLAREKKEKLKFGFSNTHLLGWWGLGIHGGAWTGLSKPIVQRLHFGLKKTSQVGHDARVEKIETNVNLSIGRSSATELMCVWGKFLTFISIDSLSTLGRGQHGRRSAQLILKNRFSLSRQEPT
jgi:hypothetical protein